MFGDHWAKHGRQEQHREDGGAHMSLRTGEARGPLGGNTYPFSSRENDFGEVAQSLGAQGGRGLHDLMADGADGPMAQAGVCLLMCVFERCFRGSDRGRDSSACGGYPPAPQALLSVTALLFRHLT